MILAMLYESFTKTGQLFKDIHKNTKGVFSGQYINHKIIHI